MKTFEMKEGFDAAYESMLTCALEGLSAKVKTSGLTMQEDNMRFQIKEHLGLDADDTSTDKAADKDIGIESYN